jgi:hypothetical protein
MCLGRIRSPTGIYEMCSNLFPSFPGFGEDTSYDAKLVFDSRLERQVSTRDLPKSVDLKGYNKFITDLADTYIKEAEACSDRGASAVICALPIESQLSTKRLNQSITATR